MSTLEERQSDAQLDMECQLPYVRIELVEIEDIDGADFVESCSWRDQAEFAIAYDRIDGTLAVDMQDGSSYVEPLNSSSHEVGTFMQGYPAKRCDIKHRVFARSLEDAHDLPQREYWIDAVYFGQPQDGPDMSVVEISNGLLFEKVVPMREIPTFMSSGNGLKAVVGLKNWRVCRGLYPRLNMGMCVRLDKNPKYFKTTETVVDGEVIVVVGIIGDFASSLSAMREHCWSARVQRLLLQGASNLGVDQYVDPGLIRDAIGLVPVYVCYQDGDSVIYVDLRENVTEMGPHKPPGCRIWLEPSDRMDPITVNGLIITGDVNWSHLIRFMVLPEQGQNWRLSREDKGVQMASIVNRYIDYCGKDFGHVQPVWINLLEFDSVVGSCVHPGYGVRLRPELQDTIIGSSMLQDQWYFKEMWEGVMEFDRDFQSYAFMGRPDQYRIIFDGVCAAVRMREVPHRNINLNVWAPIRETSSFPVFKRDRHDSKKVWMAYERHRMMWLEKFGKGYDTVPSTWGNLRVGVYDSTVYRPQPESGSDGDPGWEQYDSDGNEVDNDWLGDLVMEFGDDVVQGPDDGDDDNNGPPGLLDDMEDVVDDIMAELREEDGGNDHGGGDQVDP